MDGGSLNRHAGAVAGIAVGCIAAVAALLLVFVARARTTPTELAAYPLWRGGPEIGGVPQLWASVLGPIHWK